MPVPEPPGSAPPVPSGFAGDALRTLVDLAHLRRERREVPARLDDESRRAIAAAERQRDEQRTAADAACRARVTEVTAMLESRCAEIQAEHDTAMARIEAQTEHKKASIRERADQNLAQARTRLDEEIWVAESVHEGEGQRLTERARAVADAVARERDQIAEAWTTVRARLESHGLGHLLREADPPHGAPAREPDSAAPSVPAVPEAALGDLAAARERAAAGAVAATRLRSARIASGAAPWILLTCLVAVGAGAGAVLGQQGLRPATANPALPGIIGAVVGALAGIILRLVTRRMARRGARRIVASLRAAEADGARHGAAALRAAEDERRQGQARADRVRDAEIRAAKQRWEPAIAKVMERREAHLVRLDAILNAHAAEVRDQATERRAAAEAEAAQAIAAAEAVRRDAAARLEAAFADAQQRCDREFTEQRTAFTASWRLRLDRASQTIDRLLHAERTRWMSFDDPAWDAWQPARLDGGTFRLGRIVVDSAEIPRGDDGRPELGADLPAFEALPFGLDLAGPASLLLEHDGDGRENALALLHTAMLRLITLLPPGTARFTIIDPVGLGRTFAGFMHLADFDERLVTSRIWSEPRHLEQRLADLTEHMEHVIQKYLRNEFESIEAYNEQAGEIAEPYRFLVIADFPAGFTESAAKRLASVVSSGARCGVHTLCAWDRRTHPPAGVDLELMRSRSLRILFEQGRTRLAADPPGRGRVEIDTPPDDALVTRTLQIVGAAARDAARVEVPFSAVAPAPDAVWSRRCDTVLRVPLGRAGASKLQELEIGIGTSQHALLAGKTGSGKSTLLHVLVTNIALWYPPDEVELYLVDFKKGVEFKTYATHRLPHARAVAVESDREFGVSVLQRVDAVLRERGDLFRAAGVQDLPSWRRLNPGSPMPRVLLVIDEFQEMFVEDDRLAQEASLVLDRIVRQGRAFGIHVLLGSQTLGGAYTLARSTIGQIQVRIALQCSEADSYLILSEDNAAARLLGRPGEAIYNDAGGRIEGNSPFQIVWLPDSERETCLRTVEARATAAGWRPSAPMIVFEGSAPADLATNHLLRETAQSAPPAPDMPVRTWIGEAIAIKGPTEVTFRPQSGANLLLVGQRDEAATAIIVSMLASVAARRGHAASVNGETAAAGPTLILIDGTPADAALAGCLGSAAGALRLAPRMVGFRDIEEAMRDLGAELDRRLEATSPSPPLLLFIHGLQRFRQLRQSEDYSFSMSGDSAPAADRILARMIREGPVVRMHTILWCDTPANLLRFLDRQTLREFALRVLFQMGAADSTTLIDSPAASLLGLHRALLHNEEEGITEKFRPYALPEPGMLAHLLQGRG
ncbi:MAG: hypothetical protein KF817_01460 [Phycisphaeraceae bacterium]|nr:hypothetical protein [Phycisphaeraceae bacterium]